jgi:homoserine kinase type II
MESIRWSEYWSVPEPWSLHTQKGGINNLTHRVETPAGPYFLRVYRPDADLAHIRFELDVLQALQQADLPFGVPAPVLTRQGAPLAAVAEVYATLVPLLPGATSDWAPASRPAYAFGDALGRLTAATGRIQVDVDPFAVPTYGELHRVSSALPEPELAPLQFNLPADQQATLVRMFEALLAWVPTAYYTLPKQVIHGDYVPFNVFFAANQVSAVLDFEFACIDLRALDLATALAACGSELWGTGEEWAPIEACVRGYVRHQALTADEAAALPNIIRLRRAASFLHMAGRYKLGLAPENWLHHGAEHALQSEAWLAENGARLVNRVLSWTTA